ncbi:MAG: hypothetical protein FVQ81_13245 [Candidatus Glassbacteria bacterium]|nr:hypothetical protein [Candidatus Glassbacteria bacterium]
MASRTYKQNTWRRQKAYDLWVVVQATVEETCEVSDITARTLRRWRSYYGWDGEREKFGAGLGSLLASFRDQLGRLSQDLRNAAANQDVKRMEELNKVAGQLLVNAMRIQEIEQGVHYRRLSVQWLREFSDHLKQTRPLLLEELLPELKAFMGKIASA